MTPDNALLITPNTWIISDTHFFHINVGRYCNRPDNWQELIIKNWNDSISPEDTVLHLGDFSFGKKSNFDILTEMLNGNMILIRGNHDRMSKTRYESRGVSVYNAPIQVEFNDRVKIIFSHRPVVPLEGGWINLHGHIHNIPPPLEGSNLGLNHINMSVEVQDYRPWRLSEIITNW